MSEISRDTARGAMEELMDVARQWAHSQDAENRRRGEVDFASRLIHRHAHLLPMNLTRRSIRSKLRALYRELLLVLKAAEDETGAGRVEPTGEESLAAAVALAVFLRCQLPVAAGWREWAAPIVAHVSAHSAEVQPLGDLRSRGVHHSAEHADLSRQLTHDAGAPSLALDATLLALRRGQARGQAPPLAAHALAESLAAAWPACLARREWLHPRLLLGALALVRAAAPARCAAAMTSALAEAWPWYAQECGVRRAPGPSLLWLVAFLHQGLPPDAAAGVQPLTAAARACHRHWSPKHLLARTRASAARDPPPAEALRRCASEAGVASLAPSCDTTALWADGTVSSPPWELDGSGASLAVFPAIVRHLLSVGGAAADDARGAVVAVLRGAVEEGQPVVATRVLPLVGPDTVAADRGEGAEWARRARVLSATSLAERGDVREAVNVADGDVEAIKAVVGVLQQAGAHAEAVALRAAHGIEDEDESGVGEEDSADCYVTRLGVAWHWVDSAGAAAAATRVLEARERAAFVALDAEWRPVLAASSASAPPTPALLQVATPEDVVLIDLRAAEPREGGFREAVEVLLDEILRPDSRGARPALLGYGLEGDFGALAHWFPGIAHRFLGCPVVELSCCHALLEARGVQAGACLHGLARLVEAVLGRRLDKSWQVTNWEQRPLHPAQVRYAAADAYVVVELAQALLPAAAGPRWAQARPCMRALRADGSLAVPQPAEWCAFAGAEEGAAAVAYCSAEARRSAASVPRWEEMVPPRSRPAVGRVIRAVRAMPRAARLRDEGLVLPCAGPGSGEVVCLLDAEARGAGSVPAVSRALGVAPSSLLKTVLMECRDGEDAGAGRRAVMVALPLHRRIESGLLAQALRGLGHAVHSLAVVPARMVYAVCGSAPGEIPCVGWVSRPGAGWSIVDRVLDAAVMEGEGLVAGGGGHCASFVRGTASWVKDVGAYRACRISRPGPLSQQVRRRRPNTEGDCTRHSDGPAQPAASLGTGCPRFVLDGTVIRLAKWLRVLSVDAEVAAEERFRGMSGFVSLCMQAEQRGQRVLTLNKRHASTRMGRRVATLLQAHTAAKQLQELVGRYSLRPHLPLASLRKWHAKVEAAVQAGGPGTAAPEEVYCGRCVKCNGDAFTFLSREQVTGLIPERSRLVAMTFWQCESCRQIFWPGASYLRSLGAILAALPDNGEEEQGP